jgi:hypothetical protein
MRLYLCPLYAFVGALLFATVATAEIKGLCNTGETPKTTTGCTGVLVTPNPTGGGPNRDGNWGIAFPYPSTVSPANPCGLDFIRAWVDTPYHLYGPPLEWFPNSKSDASEWITPYDGESNLAPGWYVYITGFQVPSVLPSGSAPTGVTIKGRIASDNWTYGFLMASSAAGGSCALVEHLPVPLDPDQYLKWTDFSFTSPIPITPGSDVLLYVLVHNTETPGLPNGNSPTGLRIEFFDTSAFY